MDTILPGLPEENCQIFDINKGHDENICTPTFAGCGYLCMNMNMGWEGGGMKIVL